MLDRVMTLSDWCDVNDQPVALVPLPAEPGEFVPPDACDELTPDEEHFSEATGNAGASYERTYRRAALVLWPQERLFNVLGQGGVGVLLSWLEELAGRIERTAPRQQAALRAQATDLIRQILETWPPRNFRAGPPTETTRMLTVLARLQDATAIETFVDRIMAEGAYQASDNPALIEALALLSPDRRTGLIARMTSATAAALFAACADLLARAAAAWPELPPANLKPAAEMLLDALPDGARKPVPPAWEYRRDTLQPSFVVDLLAALCTIDPALAFRAILHVLALETVYDMDAILVPAARTLLKQCKERPQAIEQLRLACLEHLRARIAEPLEPFPDWRRPSDVPCQCPRCSELSRFLADPQRRTWSFKANQADRDHVEDTIAKARSDVDTITERRGRPYTLICTKNEASFERRTAQRTQDLNDVAALMERDD